MDTFPFFINAAAQKVLSVIVSLGQFDRLNVSYPKQLLGIHHPVGRRTSRPPRSDAIFHRRIEATIQFVAHSNRSGVLVNRERKLALESTETFLP